MMLRDCDVLLIGGMLGKIFDVRKSPMDTHVDVSLWHNVLLYVRMMLAFTHQRRSCRDEAREESMRAVVHLTVFQA